MPRSSINNGSHLGRRSYARYIQKAVQGALNGYSAYSYLKSDPRPNKRRKTSEEISKKKGNVNSIAADARSGRVVRSRRRRKKYVKRTLKKRITNLEKEVKQDRCRVREYRLGSFQVNSAINKVEYNESDLFNRAFITARLISLMKYSGTGTLNQGDPTNWTTTPKQSNVYLNQVTEYWFKNNSMQTCEFSVYQFDCVSSTNATVLATLNTGLAQSCFDSTIQNYDVYGETRTDPCTPWISKYRSKYWKLKGKDSYTLRSGDTMKLKVFASFDGNNKLFLEENQSYIKGISKQLLFRIHGHPAHESTTVGMDESHLDCLFTQNTTLSYDGLGAIKDTTATGGYGGIAAGEQYGPSVAIQ